MRHFFFIFAAALVLVSFSSRAETSSFMNPSQFAYFNNNISSGAVDKATIERLLQRRSALDMRMQPRQQLAPAPRPQPQIQAYNRVPVAPAAPVYSLSQTAVGW